MKYFTYTLTIGLTAFCFYATFWLSTSAMDLVYGLCCIMMALAGLFATWVHFDW